MEEREMFLYLVAAFSVILQGKKLTALRLLPLVTSPNSSTFFFLFTVCSHVKHVNVSAADPPVWFLVMLEKM